MKKVLLGSIILVAFSIAIVLFQISCQKTAEAQMSNYTLPPATTTNLGGIMVGSGLTVTTSGVVSATSTGGGLQQLVSSQGLQAGGLAAEIALGSHAAAPRKKGGSVAAMFHETRGRYKSLRDFLRNKCAKPAPPPATDAARPLSRCRRRGGLMRRSRPWPRR